MSLLHTNIIVVKNEAEKYQGTGELYVVCNKKGTTKGRKPPMAESIAPLTEKQIIPPISSAS